MSEHNLQQTRETTTQHCDARAASDASGEREAGIGDISILEKREIEAKIVAPIYEILVREIGTERAREIIKEAVTTHSIAEGRSFASLEPGGANLQTFIDIQDLWNRDGSLIHDTLEANEERYHYRVTHCEYAEMYRRLGLWEIGPLLSCQRDFEFIKGYDPQVVLDRSPSIMEGNNCCDFRYRSTRPEHAGQDTPR